MKVPLASCIFILMGGCSSASTSRGNPDSHSFAVGVNVSSLDYYGGTGPFLNLIYGSSWAMQDPSGGSQQDVPASSLDGNGWVKLVPSGYRIFRALAVPSHSGQFVCRFRGNGTLNVSGSAVSSVSTSPGVTRFKLTSTFSDPKSATLNYVLDPTNYIRDIDCRSSSASTTDRFTPEFTSTISGFTTIRFMKWQTATEGNWPVTWATRNKPGDGDYQKNDGVPIELMVEAANRASANLWVTVPWNSDDDYVRRFATYVRDNLARNHHVYVEVSNEVWNGGYPVAAQAAKEARSEGLPSATGSGIGSTLERYAEKTQQVMKIWSSVFVRQKSRLVRIAAFQHVSPYFSDALLKYRHLNQSVDALATAPYFGFAATDTMSSDQIMSGLPGEVANTVKIGVQQKKIATKYGLRYVTYEAGQTIVLRNNAALEQQVQRDPRMYGVYRQFISQWRDQIGDQLNLFSLTGAIGPYGGWGLVEYLGQPISQTPKMRAVEDFVHRSEGHFKE